MLVLACAYLNQTIARLFVICGVFTIGAIGGPNQPQCHPSPQQMSPVDMGPTSQQAVQQQKASSAAARSTFNQKPAPTAQEVDRYLRTRGMGSFELKPEIAAWRQAVSRAMRPMIQSQSSADLYVAPCLTGIKEQTSRYVCT